MEELKDFDKRLLFMRKSNKLTQKQLAQELGINERTYQRLETGKSLPSHKTLNSIINFFGEEYLNYLIGRTDDPTRL